MAKETKRPAPNLTDPRSVPTGEQQTPGSIVQAWVADGKLPPAVGLALDLLVLQEGLYPLALPGIPGANPRQIEKILRGQVAPHIDTVALYDRWKLLRQPWRGHTPGDLHHLQPAPESYDTQWWTRRKAIRTLSKVYAGVDRLIQNDSALSQALKEQWNREYPTIRDTLKSLQEEASRYSSLPRWRCYTVGLQKDLSRHGFWTPVVVALVEQMPTRKTNRSQAFRDVAVLLHSAFPEYPDNPDLVERRFYSKHSRQHAKTDRR